MAPLPRLLFTNFGVGAVIGVLLAGTMVLTDPRMAGSALSANESMAAVAVFCLLLGGTFGLGCLGTTLGTLGASAGGTGLREVYRESNFGPYFSRLRRAPIRPKI